MSRLSRPRRILAAAAFAILAMTGGATPALAADGAPGSSEEKAAGHPIPVELAGQIKRAEMIGRLLYVLDHVGAVGTDVLRENIKEADRAELGGYLPVADMDENGTQVGTFTTYFFTRDTPARIAYTVTLHDNNEREFRSYQPTALPSLSIAHLIEVRQNAIKALPPPQQPMNPVALPAELIGEEGTLIYFLAGTTTPNTAVFGKHYRVVVAPDNTTVKSVTPMTKSIMEMPTKAPTGTTTAMLVVTQLLTDYPTETQVCTNLMLKIPVGVVTERGVWQIRGGYISFVGSMEELQASLKADGKK